MRALIGVTLALTLAAPLGASAADWYTGVPTDGPPNSNPPSVAIDVAVDGSSQRSISGAVIGTISPFGTLDRSGWRMRLTGLGGTFNYLPSTAGLGRVTGTLTGGAFMTGYEWVTKTSTVAAYGGVEVVNTSLTPNDPKNTTKGTRGGFRVGVDFYVLPSDVTMLSGVAYYSTNNNGYYGRVKFGMAVADQLYFGPEALALGDNFFTQWRGGAHLSGLKLGVLQMGVSGGYLNDQVRGPGAYGIFETRLTF